MPFMTKVLRVVTEGEQVGGATVAQPVRLVGADGEDVELGGGAQTTIPTGALVPGAGIDLARDEDTGVITASVKAGSIGTEQLKAGSVNTSALLDGAVTAAKLAAGVAVSGPKGDTGADGKSVTALALTTDATGKVTGGTVTFSDKTTAAVTVTVAQG